MPLSFWIFTIVFVLGFVTLVLLWLVLTITFRLTRWIVRRTMLTELIGKVVDRAYSQPRVEVEWMHCLRLTDPCTAPWLGMEPPVLIHRHVPALPSVRIRLLNGSFRWHECTAGEYETWTDGSFVQIDVYAIGSWTFYTSEPKLVA